LYKGAGFSQEIENLLQIVLRSYTGLFSDYVYINEALLTQRTGKSAHEVYEGLKFLSERHIVHYVPAKKVPTIYYVQNREELKYLNIAPAVYEERKERLKNRIEQVVRYGSTNIECRSKMLLNYFGEKEAKDCGHCDVCLFRKHQDQEESLIKQTIRAIPELLGENERMLDEVIALARFPKNQVIEAIRFLCDNGQLEMTDNKIRKK
jgi:ATP-dependent DNA helicase RecQ